VVEIIGFEDLKWYFRRPSAFPCYICNDAEATVFLKFRCGKTAGKIPVCPECSTKEAAEIMRSLKGEG